MIHPYFQQKLPEVQKALLKYNVKTAFVFGSVCTEHFSENSDIDIIVDFEESLSPIEKGENCWDLYYFLKTLLNREIDLLTSNSLTNPYFIEEVNHTKVPIYGY